jgi:DNA recombination protein RmuC
VGTLAEHFRKLGRNLDSAVHAYNETVGSLEYRVLPQARKFKELQAATKDDIPALEPVDRSARRTDSPEMQPLPKAKDASLFN